MWAEYSLQKLLTYVGFRARYKPYLATLLTNLLNQKDPVQYKIQKEELTKLVLEDYQIAENEPKNVVRGGMFDLPVQGNIELKLPQKDKLVLTSPIVNANLSKHIVTTPLVRYDGTVKEYVSMGDWQIEVKGFFCQHEEAKPLQELTQMLAYVKEAREIEITSEYINALGVYSVVVTELDLPAVPYGNLIAYRLSLLSDKPFELKYKDKRNV